LVSVVWIGSAARWRSPVFENGAAHGDSVSDSRPLPPPSHAQNAENRLAGSLLLLVDASVTTFPGAVLGAAITWLFGERPGRLM